MPSLLFEDEDINRQPETNFVPSVGAIPTRQPDDTYTGTIPTPRADYGSTALNMPHDYWGAKSLLRKGDPKALELLLQLIYHNRDNRRT